MRWTDEQQKVIKYRDRNILVSAAAGSGKTAVLVERIIQRITDPENPMDIDRFLVVTFTKAAAAEMRERIGNAIEKLLEEHPEDENLRKQQTLIHNARITTTDSFCLFVVRNYFQEIDLEPNFRIADAGEMKLLEMDVLNAVFEREFAGLKEQNEEQKAFGQLMNAYASKYGNGDVKGMVSKIYRQSASNPWPKEWIASLAKPYEVASVEELMETEMMQGIFTYVKSLLQDIPAKLEALRDIAMMSDGPQGYVENLNADIDLFQGLDEVDSFQQLAAFCQKLDMGNLSSIYKYQGDPQKKEAVASGRKAIKDEVKSLRQRYFALPLEELVEQLRRMRPVAQELVRLSLRYLEAMDEEKRKKHIMDFSDVEHAALRIFVDENTKELRPTAIQFKRQFDEIMMDEYQDSNQVQEEIMCAISRESEGEYNMFMVGDVKQSIYRFRLARPELFMEKFATYDLEDSKKQRIDLHKNFRSRNEVLEFTNDIFYKIMDADLGNVTYDKEAALYCGAEYPEADNMTAEVLLYETAGIVEEEIEGAEAVSGEEDLDSLSNRQMEARMVAERILELKKTLLVTDKTSRQLRPLRNSDIVILLRSLQGWGNDFAAILNECGIPAHVSTSTGYFSAIEVQTVLSLLKILDNPYQDIPMAAVLKSAIVGLDNEELAEIRMTTDATSFADAALKCMEAATEGKLYQFQILYQRLRKRIVDTPIHQLITMLLEETGYGDYVKALPAGAQRRANLEMLIEKAICFEQTSYKGLFHFVRYIDQLQKYEVDFGEADVTGENEDVVRLMTIHKSKGLEFPVVFVSGIAKNFNNQDSKDKMALHPDMGLGLDELRSEPRTKRKCLIRSEIADRVRRDNLGEELRVLYVALTRAKEKLILTGVVKSQEKLFAQHKGMVTEGKALSFSQRTKAKGYIDWIAPAILSYPDKYEFVFKNAMDMVLTSAKKEAEEELSKIELLEQIKQADKKLVQTYQQAFSYVYPYKVEANRKSKYSVSELKHASMVEKYDQQEGNAEIPEFLLQAKESYIPDFAKDVTEEAMVEAAKGEKGAMRGTAVHRVMQCLDFEALLNLQITEENLKQFVNEQLSHMLEKQLITEEMDALIPRYMLLEFLKSPVALRMAEADARGELFREKPFVMDYEGVLLQGIIDVFWIEDNRIILLDYKTDWVETKEELITRYATQLHLYGDALQRIFASGKNPITKVEEYIYSFRLGEWISITDEK